MEILYNIAIVGTLLLGLMHSTLTFKTYKKDDQNAYWFFSAGLALIVTAILNYINLKTQSEISLKLTLIANLLVFLFSVVLSLKLKKAPMFSVTFFTLILLISAFLFITK